MNWLLPAVVSNFTATLLLTLIFWYLYQKDREMGIGLWSLAWTVLLCRLGIEIGMIQGIHNPVFGVLSHIFAVGGALCLLWGTYSYLGLRRPLWPAALGGGIAIWIILLVSFSAWQRWYGYPTPMYASILYCWTGMIVLKNFRPRGVGTRILGFTFIVWGILIVSNIGTRGREDWMVARMALSSVLEISAALGIIIHYYGRSQAELLESRRHYRNLFEENRAVMLLLDAETGTIVEANNAAAQFYGFTREELCVKSAFELSTAPASLLKEEWKRALSGEKSYFVFKHKLANGSLRDVEIYSGPISMGGRTHLYAVIHDITLRKQTEEELKKSRNLLESTFEAIQDALFIIDAASPVILECNSSALMMFGYTREELLGSPVAKLHMNGTASTDYLNILRKDLRRRGFVFLPEFSMQRKDGSAFPVEHYVVPLKDDGGMVFAYVESIKDLSGQKQLEHELLQSQKMESVGTLAGGIAHDFNNILAMIGTATEMILKVQSDNPAVRRYAEMIQKASGRGASITKQLLLFSRKELPEKKTILLASLVREMSDLLRHSLPKSIQIESRLLCEGRVLGDPTHLIQAMMNISVNARDAMPAGGILTFGVSSTTITAQSPKQGIPPGDYILLTITDTGSGMPAETAAHIFDPFFTTKPRGKGTGLGLSIVDSIIKNHEGYISVQSTPGLGTTFSIFLPEDTSATGHPIETPSDEMLTGSATVLVVDDEEILRETLKDILTSHGYRVLTADTGQVALDLYSRLPGDIDCVLSDLDMPGMNGLRLYDTLKDIDPALRFIISTGYFDSDLAATTGDRRFAGYLPKPFTTEDVLQVLYKALRS